MKICLLPAFLFLFTFSHAAQSTQTIRGRVVDEVSQTPLIGVNIRVMVGESTLGAVSDENGNYRINGVPLGRQTLVVSYTGYADQTFSNIIVTAGKEVILNIPLTEQVSNLDEVVITSDGKEDKTATNNDLAVVSSRSFNVEETKRYAGAVGDPSRMAANFAGVAGGNDARNDIVVRGNSPTGMLWQLEGLNIPNPNHFGALVATGGPVSILNNNNIDKSDFMTSAFPAQYGNATAGVFDIKLRNGNNEKHEFTSQVGFNGFELGAEGPLSKKSEGSYIINYRYSTLAVFQQLGIEFGTGGNTPLYEDLNFKINLPAGEKGKLSIFGLGGKSAIDLLGSKADLNENADLYGNENTDSYPRYRTGVMGVSYEHILSRKTFARLTLGASNTQESFYADSLVRNTDNEVVARYLRGEASFTTTKYSVNLFTRTKLDSRNSLTSGGYIDLMNFDLFNRDVYANTSSDTVRLNVDDNTILYQVFTTWKHRFNNNLSLNTGLHAQYYNLNQKFALEPRMSFQYMINGFQSLSLGYGLHHQAQNITTSFLQTRTAANTIIETNRGLDFTRSHHYVLTYDWNFSRTTRLKAEVYYQSLGNVPVEYKPSSFSTLNTGSSFVPIDQDSLVNAGAGRNYGMELTLERFFSKGYYYLVTASLFDSRYQGSDGIKRNTAFNTRYVLNVLGGKEWKVSKRAAFLSINMKLTTIGGKYLTPIDIERSQQRGRTVYDDANAFSEKQDPYFRIDVKLSYRKEFAKSTLEIALDLQNITNYENVFSQSYNPRTNTISTQYQQAFFPVPFVRFTF